jgi:hypothetical protein
MKTKARKDLILSDTTNGIIIFFNVLSDHLKIAKMFEKEVNNPIKEGLEIQLVKKRPNMFGVVISNFFVVKDPL